MLSNSPVIHLFRKTNNFHSLPEVPAVSPSSLRAWHVLRALHCRDKSPVERNLVAAGSCFHPAQRGSEASLHKAPRLLPTGSGTSLLPPGHR